MMVNVVQEIVVCRHPLLILTARRDMLCNSQIKKKGRIPHEGELDTGLRFNDSGSVDIGAKKHHEQRPCKSGSPVIASIAAR
ncbi:MAG: hypothetical protein ACYDC8_13850 [Gammaproteobacteria bacterium]